MNVLHAQHAMFVESTQEQIVVMAQCIAKLERSQFNDCADIDTIARSHHALGRSTDSKVYRQYAPYVQCVIDRKAHCSLGLDEDHMPQMGYHTVRRTST